MKIRTGVIIGSASPHSELELVANFADIPLRLPRFEAETRRGLAD